VTVEVEDLDQLADALAAGAERIMLDNMTPADMRRAVAAVAGRAEVEASGGVTLTNVREIASTGVDVISVGAVTHSAPWFDVSMEIR
jgi:nicotinate-nucleotide pyrophosphorylase (carboxylating)